MKKIKLIDLNDINKMLNINSQDCIKAQLIEKEKKMKHGKIPLKFNRAEFYRDVFSDDYVEGFIMSYPHGTVIKQSRKQFYYRGENKLFPETKSSLARKLDKITNEKEKKLYIIESEIRLIEFYILINKFEIVKKFNNFGISVLHEHLAQHYGFATRYVDITSDFEVALFFACCKYNNDKQRWEPLTENDITSNEIAQYGVIFKRDSKYDMLDLLRFSQTNNLYNLILLVGYQPFMRTAKQSAYSLYFSDNNDLKNDDRFELFKFKHSTALSNYIYNKMGNGNEVYPREGLITIIDQLHLLQNAKEFSNESFEIYIKDASSIDKQKLINDLKEINVSIGKSPLNLSRNRIREFNRKLKKMKLEEYLGVNFSTRRSYSGS